MHERPPEPPAPAVEPTSPPAARDEPTREHADELVFKSDLREFFEWRIEDEEDWPYLPQTLRREWIQEQARELFERLGDRALSEELLLSNPPNDAGPALERALAELRLPRRYPLLLEHDGLLELTPLATELISIEPGRVRVHGAFFPNLLSNGVADGLVLPTFAVERVIAAAGLLMSFPSTPTQDVVHTLGSCSVGPGLETLGMSEVFSLELTAHPRLGFHAVTAEPFSERQASAIVETMGLHRKLHLLVLERAALVAELEARASPFRPAEIDRLLHLERSRVAAMAPSGRAAQWS